MPLSFFLPTHPLESDLIPYRASDDIPAQSVLVLAPHPDDEVFACGGAIARHIKSGTPVCVVVLTDGALYADASTRQQESVAAATILGYGTPEFWAYPDRELRYSEELVQRLVAKISHIDADLVYAPSPWEIHPDHRQAQMLAVAAIRRSNSKLRLAFYEVGVPLRPNLLLDITVWLETKAAAMRCFASQLTKQNYVDHIQALNRFRTFTLPNDVLAAEAFWVVSARELEQSVWSELLTNVSLGKRYAKPLLIATSINSIEKHNPSGSIVRTKKTTDEISALQLDGADVVSVLIRTIDRPSLNEAIASVLSQSFSGWEIILVNASGHPLTELAPTLAKKVKLVLEPGCPLGRSSAANALLDSAHGKYAVFLDDDDQLLPDHLQKLVHALDADSTLVAAYCDVQATLIPGNDDLDARIHIYQREFDWALLQFQNYLPIHSVMFRIGLARSHEECRFDDNLVLFEDWDFWLQLAEKGDFLRVPGVSALYALDASSGSGHAVHNDSLRKSMLQRLGQRQLARWRSTDVVALIEWQIQRTQDLEQSSQEISSGVMQIEQAKSAIGELNRSLSEHQIEINKLGQVRLEILQQLVGAQSNVIDLGQRLFDQQCEIGRLDQLRHDHQKLLAEASEQSQIQLQQYSALAQQHATLAQQHSTLTQQNTALEQEHFALVRMQSELSQHLTDLAHRVSTSNANEFAQHLEIEKLGRLRIALFSQIEGLNAQLIAMYGSTSWRLTRPLRVIMRLMRWLVSPRSAQFLRNGFRAANGEIRRHSLSGFVRRLPHYWRHRHTYGVALTHVLPPTNAHLFKATPVPGHERRLHPDLMAEKVPIDASISVVIPTFNAGMEFLWLLRKLKTQKGLRQLEIVIVDSGSGDQTVQWAKEAGCVVVEISQAEFSHSHARNLGAAHASADYLIFMVQDAYPIGDYWAYGMLRYLLDHRDSGLVAASCSEYGRSDSDMMYDSMIDTHYRFLGCHDQDRIGDYQGSDHMALRSRGQLSDVACLISREIFGKYGYHGDYAEDLDLGIRLIKDGHRVAMLASVKVVHSHNRAAFYYLKRSYVDVIFLVTMFDDFLVPAVDSIEGLLAGVVSCAGHVSDLLPTLDEDLPQAALSHTLTTWIGVCRQRCQEVCTDTVLMLGDTRLDAYINHLRERIDQVTLDGMALNEAKRFADSFFARLEHFNSFIANVYGNQDKLLQIGLQDAVRKTFAATAGSMLGFMYMDGIRRVVQNKELVQEIDDELRRGV